ncbi:MAG: hypothetical protein Q9206_003746 [Seirophora lacunosa]
MRAKPREQGETSERKKEANKADEGARDEVRQNRKHLHRFGPLKRLWVPALGFSRSLIQWPLSFVA